DRIAPNIFNILCLPAVANFSTGGAVTAYSQALDYCAKNRAFLIADVPESTKTKDDMLQWIQTFGNETAVNGAVYFPRLTLPDPLANYRPKNVAPSGTLAGIYAATDSTNGVWKSPAGIDAVLQNADLVTNLSDSDTGDLNTRGVNVLRSFAVYGNVVWGARTLAGADLLDSQWKYVSVRRTADYIEDSLVQSLKWVVFENNDERLWAQIRAEVSTFMAGLFADGAFAGASADQAYLVQCDATTTTASDIAQGIVNIVIGFAPERPAEFVVLKLMQLTA
ncbi:MAG: phage tail sheath C-terminal domain-containing protein, partial [Acidobacteriota bacterium]